MSVRGFAVTSAKQAVLLLALHYLLTGTKSFSQAGSVGELWLFTPTFAKEGECLCRLWSSSPAAEGASLQQRNAVLGFNSGFSKS